MFSQIHGLPLHPLAVHAAVIFVPLAAFLGVLFAVPRTRVWSRIPLALVSIAALASVFVAKQSGQKLRDALGLQGPVASLIAEHQRRANLLMILVLIFTVIALVAVFVSRDAQRFNGALAIAVSAVVVVGAVVVGIQTYRVGDIGSKALWNPTGTIDYGSSADGH